MSTTKSRRRSTRIKKKNGIRSLSESDEESVSAIDEEEIEEESPESTDENYKTKLRNTNTGKVDLSQEQDMAQIEGDPKQKYKDGDCVWAKFEDYPWWPGQIELSNANSRRRKSKKAKQTITVKWFGDFDEIVECPLLNVIPWDPDDADRICVEVEEEDLESFQDSMDNANTTHLQICEERGEKPSESAVSYEEKNALRSKEALLNNTNTKPKSKPKTPKRKKKAIKKRKKPKKPKPKATKVDSSSAPELEPIDDGHTEVNERRSSLRSAAKKKDTETDVSPRKPARRRRKSSNASQSSQSESESDKPPKNKRGRKRKLTEAMNGDKSERESESSPKQKRGRGRPKKTQNKAETVNKRRSVRIKKRQMNGSGSGKEEESNESESNTNSNECLADPKNDNGSHLNTAYEMCADLHSGNDWTPFIGLFYFGVREYNKRGSDKENDVTQTVAKIFNLREEEVLQHLSEFVEAENKWNKGRDGNARKKRKLN